MKKFPRLCRRGVRSWKGWVGVLMEAVWIGLASSGVWDSVLWAEQSKPKVPRWFAYRCPYTESEPGTVRRFAQIGVHLVHISPLNTLCSLGTPYSPYPPSWVGPGRYDFSPVDQYIAEVIQADPQAQLMCGVDLNPPAWWVRMHRRPDSFWELGRVAADEKWRQDTRAYLEAFLRHTESRYKDRIVAYTLFCGSTLEWYDSSEGQESSSRLAAWRTWMTRQGQPDPVDIPPVSIRERATHGLLRDPEADRLAVAYWRFHNWLVGDTILYFAQAAQEVLHHRVPVGIFYGYLCELPGAAYGHLDFDRLCRSDLVDFFMAPSPYQDRAVGGAGGFMVPVGSVLHHGKGFLQELDHRTHTCRGLKLPGVDVPPPLYDAGFPTLEASRAGLRREFAIALIQGTSLWWFNIFGHIYDDPKLMEAIGQMRQLWERFAVPEEPSAAEIAVFVDPESFLYLDGRSPKRMDFLYRQRMGLGRIGAPYDLYSIADLPELDLSRYKMIFFPNLFVVDKTKRQILQEKVCIGGKTVVWVHAPGIITEGRYDPANVERLCGIAYGAKQITLRAMDGWTSVLAPEPNLSASVLRELAQKAGVHIYCDKGWPVYAHRRLLAVHTDTGGLCTIRLPRPARQVRELFSNRIAAENADHFEDRLQGPDTVLYLIQWE